MCACSPRDIPTAYLMYSRDIRDMYPQYIRGCTHGIVYHSTPPRDKQIPHGIQIYPRYPPLLYPGEAPARVFIYREQHGIYRGTYIPWVYIPWVYPVGSKCIGCFLSRGCNDMFPTVYKHVTQDINPQYKGSSIIFIPWTIYRGHISWVSSLYSGYIPWARPNIRWVYVLSTAVYTVDISIGYHVIHRGYIYCVPSFILWAYPLGITLYAVGISIGYAHVYCGYIH